MSAYLPIAGNLLHRSKPPLRAITGREQVQQDGPEKGRPTLHNYSTTLSALTDGVHFNPRGLRRKRPDGMFSTTSSSDPAPEHFL
jgi:hypothetical protein